MMKILINRCGFSEEDIIVLVYEGPYSFLQPTGKNIRLALSLLVASVKPGDVLFIHYSGRSMLFPVKNPENEDIAFIECLVPSDFNLITDDEFRSIVYRVPRDCKMTTILDSCQSSGLIEGAKEQIGESTETGHSWFGFVSKISLFRTKSIEPDGDLGDYNYVKNRSLPVSTFIDILRLKSEKDDIDERNLIPTLFDIFGVDSSPVVKNFMNVGLDNFQHGGDQSDGDWEILGMVDKQEAYPGSTKSSFPDCGILMTACLINQVAVEASLFKNSDEVYGVFSHAILSIIQETDGRVTNRELSLNARKKLELELFTQKPGLYCSDYHVGAPFMCNLIETQSLCKQVIDLNKKVAKMNECVTGLRGKVGKLKEENEGLKAEMENAKLKLKQFVDESFANAVEQLKVLNPCLCTEGAGSHRCVENGVIIDMIPPLTSLDSRRCVDGVDTEEEAEDDEPHS